MSTVPRDKARQLALLKAELFAAAWAAIEKLSDDQCAAIYLKIEEERLASVVSDNDDEVIAESRGKTEPARTPASTPAKPQTEPELPVAEAKRRAAEDVEREHLARLMEQTDGSVTDAAELAGMDRSNFRKRLQKLGLREPGKKKPGPKYTDQILQILDENRAGLRTHEIAKKTRQAGPNAFRTLKLLEQQGRVARHGARTRALWTLPGVEPVQRVESIPAMVVDVLSRERLPMTQRLIALQVERILRAKGRKLNEATLRQEITRLVEKGVVAFAGANEHGPMFALIPKGESDLN